MSRNRFAYRIDYAKAIADDEAAIKLYEDGGPVDRLARAFAPLASVFAGWVPDHGVDALAVAASVSLAAFDAFVTTAGIDRREALAQVLAGCVDYTAADDVSAEAERVWPRGSGSYAAAERSALPGVPYVQDAQRRDLLKRARASLSRHRRNADR